MTAREKVLHIEQQVRAMLDGERTDFECPFCNQITAQGEGILCCDDAAEVINAILDHIEFLERAEVIDRVMDHFSDAESRVLLN